MPTNWKHSSLSLSQHLSFLSWARHYRKMASVWWGPLGKKIWYKSMSFWNVDLMVGETSGDCQHWQFVLRETWMLASRYYSWYITYKWRVLPAGGTGWRVRGSPQLLGFDIWEPWMSVHNCMAIHPVVVEIFHPCPKSWTWKMDKPRIGRFISNSSS